MKCIIIYLSITGNTEKIARRIQAGVEQAAGHCDLVRLKEANWRSLQDYDLIGIGCPVLGFREPDVVQSFVKSIKFVGGKHCFAFGTHGTRPEFFFPRLVPTLKRRGLVVIGTYNCYAACYISGMPNPYPSGGHPDEIDYQEAEAFGREMVARSRRIYAGETNLIPPTPKMPKTAKGEMVPSARKPSRKEDERIIAEDRAKGIISIPEMNKVWLQFDKEKCHYPKCQLCQDNCPVDGIDMTLDPPVIGKPCMNCMLCAFICPTGAMYENEWSVKAYAEHAKAQMKDFYLPPLEKAEAEGRFRRLVPIDKIGLDTPVYKKYAKRPRLVIKDGRIITPW